MNTKDIMDTARTLVAGDKGLLAAVNTMPRWKGQKHDNKYPATQETCGIAKKG
jgi:hypothetical protein